MTHRRRITDRLPLSAVVSPGNLDDRLDTINTRHADHEAFDNERWVAHREVHTVVAESLKEYKRDANEWRATLTDLRTTFMPKAEFASEHRALDAKLHGEIVTLAAKLDTLDARLDQAISEIKDARVEAGARRGVFSDTRNVISAAALVFGIIVSGLLILDRLRP
jgi:hypothetical protein